MLGAAEVPPAAAPANLQNSLETQRKSIEKQRQAIRGQMAVPQGQATNSFFTSEWMPGNVAAPMPIAAPPAAPPAGPAPAATTTASIDCDPMPDAELSPLIEAAAQREGVKAALVRAVIRQESGFRPCAVSPKGAQGLMQLMPATSERLHVADPFNPTQNVDAGTKFLKELLGRYSGDLKLALGAYNAGAARVDSTGQVPDIAETKDYVSNILSDVGGGDKDDASANAHPAGTT